MNLYAPTGPDVLRPLLDRLVTLRALRGPAVTGFPDEVRDVVVIASSSRGGSSMVAETLRKSRDLLHFTAEINPFLRLAELDHPASGTGSDRLGAPHLQTLPPSKRHMLAMELALDAGSAADVVDDEQYALDVAWRLIIQWPELPLHPLQLVNTTVKVLHRVRARHGWRTGEVPDPALHFAALLDELRRQGTPISPWHYDLPRHLRQQLAPEPAVSHAPGEYLIEEPPFVLARPWRRARLSDVRNKPLVIKTPSNVHRIGFLRALFPHARFRVLHLIRNPAAAINGLYDGWLHNGFHAHRMHKPLGITDYVEQCADNRLWWKFDLPPGWEEFTEAPLTDVCAFQWRTSHQAILDELAGGGMESLTLRFEDLIGSAGGRIAGFAELSDWLGIPLEGDFRRAVYEGIDPVVATAAPRAGRWRRRAPLIERALGPQVLRLAERLEYVDRAEWI